MQGKEILRLKEQDEKLPKYFGIFSTSVYFAETIKELIWSESPSQLNLQINKDYELFSNVVNHRPKKIGKFNCVLSLEK
jgi:hypothetical protein